MKYIFINFKRFDIPRSLGGISDCADPTRWASDIMTGIDAGLLRYAGNSFVAFMPEAHLLGALAARRPDSIMELGCQSVHCFDVAPQGNFGAFTTGRTAKSMTAIGCSWTIIGHSEERRDLKHVLSHCDVKQHVVISGILNERVKSALAAGLKVLYCVGETEDEQPDKYTVIKQQLLDGLAGIDPRQLLVAYEPVWAIGPGKKVPDAAYIQDIAAFIKSVIPVPVVYGGGLKEDNAAMLASVAAVDGGLIGLTRFTGDIGFHPDEFLRIVDRYLA
jgi:triosephosphate isomerase